MNIEIKEGFCIDLYGFSGTAVNKNWAATGSGLMNKLWQEIKASKLEHKGINVWVYEKDNALFAGIELVSPEKTGMELKQVRVAKYASFKHIGPYQKLGESYAAMKAELEQKGIEFCLPFLEVYGHWTPDDSKLETDILFSLR